MKYNYCGKSGLQLPAVSLGLWHNFGSIDNYGPVAGSAETNLAPFV